MGKVVIKGKEYDLNVEQEAFVAVIQELTQEIRRIRSNG